MKPDDFTTFCQRCHMRCRMLCRVSDGRITHITNTMGVDCSKGIHTHGLLYHPDRLLTPLKRAGKRGEGIWQRISWDEALDTIATTLSRLKKKHGAEAIATIRGSGHKQTPRFATLLFSHIIGTPNVLDVNEECNVPSTMMSKVMTGDSVLNWDLSPDYRNSKCILLWGSNRKHTGPPQAREIERARLKGAKLILVDPRPPEPPKNRELSPTDLWLRVRPGSDGALALSMINVIISEGLYNKDFVDKWCIGFEELSERVRDYTPKKVTDITWVPEEKIIEAARLFASTSPSCIHLRLGGGGGVYTNCSQTSRSITALQAIAGDIDVPGGNLLSEKLEGFRDVFGLSQLDEIPLPPEVEEKRFGAKEFPLIAGTGRILDCIEPHRCANNTLAIQAMLRGDIKAFFIPGANPVVSMGNTGVTRKAIESLEFVVTSDLFLTPTAQLADIALPAAHFYETEVPIRAFQYMGPNYNNYVLAPIKVVEPAGECWDDRKIILELAKRMGVSIPWTTVEDLNNWQLANLGAKYEDIRDKPSRMLTFPLEYKKYESTGFNTPSGKIELYSSIFKKLGYDPLPDYDESAQSPVRSTELAKDYPLILIDHRTILFTNSEFQDCGYVHEQLPSHEIEINPHTATELGINEGDRIYIERPGFSQKIKGEAKFVPELHPRVISCICLRWFPGKSTQESIDFETITNTVVPTEPVYDPINGNPQVRGLLCRVIKA